MDLRKLIQKQKMIVGAVAFLILILILIAVYFLFIKKNGSVKEVYYADKAGTNATRYQFSSKNDAESYANSLGGTLANLEQLIKAHGGAQNMDICWFGWASDGKVYTVSQPGHIAGSACDGINSGVTQQSVTNAGAWVYGVKPSSYTNCTDYNITTPCIIHT